MNAINVSGSGNAVTSITKSGKTISFIKGATFLTSHQSLAGYATESWVKGLKYITDADAAAKYQPKGNYLTSHQDISGKSDKTHTHSVKINGIIKTIPATGGTPVDLGNYLTSHQSLAGYAKTSQIPTKVSQLTNDSGFLTSHQSLAAYLKTADADSKYLEKTAKAASASIADNASKVNGHTVYANVPSNAKFTDTEYVIPTLSSAPTSSTLTFTDNGVTRSFKVGYMCRVADSSAEHGYKFYQLYNISDNNAVWGEMSGGDYNETVTVTLKSTVSSSDSKLNGAVVTVKNTMTNETQTQIWMGVPLVFKIPAVNTYTVSASNVSGYVPLVELSYTAGVGTSRAVAMVYKNIPIGIHIYDTDGNFTKADDWNTANNGKVVGVSVCTENSAFVIAPTYDNEKRLWSSEDSIISGIVTSTDVVTAKKDYAGESNTDKIIAQLGTGNALAAEYCRNYTFKNGKKGYLWSMGEAQDAYNNKAAIDAAISKIGGTAMMTDSMYWTSTQYSDHLAWILGWLRNNVNGSRKQTNYYVRAVCAF